MHRASVHIFIFLTLSVEIYRIFVYILAMSLIMKTLNLKQEEKKRRKI